MIAEELINQMIPPLKLGDDAGKALSWMEELHVDVLPVAENGQFLGFVSEGLLLENNDESIQIKDIDLVNISCKVSKLQHFYDVIKIAADYESGLVAVISEEERFMGVVAVGDIIAEMSKSAAIQSRGGIIVLTMNHRDYSLEEISRHIESNYAKILSAYVINDPNDTEQIKVVLKVNKEDLSHILATLERFGYQVVAKFQESPSFTNEKERFDMLMRFLGT